MNRKTIAKYLVLCATLIFLLAAPVTAPFVKAHPAQITAKGTLTLTNFSGEDDINLQLDVSFVSLVPEVIERDKTYSDVEFRGFAIADEKGLVKFEGILCIGKINFWVQFAYKPSDQQIPKGRYSVKGSLEVTISEATLPPPQITWVLMKGIITKFGENNATGGLMAHAKIGEPNNWTKVEGVFRELPPPTETATPKNLNCSFYVVTLINVTKTEINNGESDLYIEGKWNVHNRTCTAIIADSTEATITITVEPIVQNVSGHLSATLATPPEPSLFTLQIDKLDDITGIVTFFHFKLAKPFERGIPRGDFNKDRIVNLQDIMQIAKAFKARLGEPRYNFDLDITSDFVINLADVVAFAKEYGQDY